MRKIIAILILGVLLLSACNDTTTSSFDEGILSNSDISDEIMLSINKKAGELNGTILKYDIDELNNALAVIQHDETSYDYWFFTADTEALVLTADLYAPTCIKHIENGETFLILFQTVIGPAYPANIVTAVNSKPFVLSQFTDGSELPKLFYSPFGNIVCMRGIGVSAGACNVLPYYWNEQTGSFIKYGLHEISIDEIKQLDKNNIVENIDGVISAYIRDNGLVHLNYADISESFMGSDVIASKTYINTGTELRAYDFDNDAKYGFFLETLSVKE